MKKLTIILFLFLPSLSHAITLAELRKEVRRQVNDIPTPKIRFTNSHINDAINEAQRNIAINTYAVQRTTIQTIVSLQNNYVLPTYCFGVKYVTRNTTTGQSFLLKEITREQLAEDINRGDLFIETSTVPYSYYMSKLGFSVILYPRPSGTALGNVNINCFGIPENLVNDIDVPFNMPELGYEDNSLYAYHDLIVKYAVYKLFLIKGDVESARKYKNDYDLGIAIMSKNSGHPIEETPVPSTITGKIP